MKHNPLLLSVIFLTGCAASTDQLHANAMGCGKELVVEPNGIVRAPTEQEKSEQCKPFWDVYNKRLESQAKSEERRMLAKQCCTKRNGRPMMNCKCIRPEEFQEIFRRAGSY